VFRKGNRLPKRLPKKLDGMLLMLNGKLKMLNGKLKMLNWLFNGRECSMHRLE
jgi:hypothetical protein